MSNARRFRPDDLLGPLNEVERKNAPEWLYVEGDTSLLHPGPRVAIVGTRTPSREGLARTTRLARELVGFGVVVTSGLARGIDTAAHRAAIDAGGRTIAVLGTPLDVEYPKENASLQRQIAREHLVLTQFAEGQPANRTNFPRRNRTMALIASATVIVEAGASSGTVSQGWEALRLGRALFLMRSLVENKQLDWPAEMIRYGAQVLTDTTELLDFIPPAFLDSRASLAF